MARKLRDLWRGVHCIPNDNCVPHPTVCPNGSRSSPNLAKQTAELTRTHAQNLPSTTSNSTLNTWVPLHPLAFDANIFHNRQTLPCLWLTEYLIQFRLHALGPVYALQQMIIFPCTSAPNKQKLHPAHEMQCTLKGHLQCSHLPQL